MPEEKEDGGGGALGHPVLGTSQPASDCVRLCHASASVPLVVLGEVISQDVGLV